MFKAMVCVICVFQALEQSGAMITRENVLALMPQGSGLTGSLADYSSVEEYEAKKADIILRFSVEAPKKLAALGPDAFDVYRGLFREFAEKPGTYIVEFSVICKAFVFMPAHQQVIRELLWDYIASPGGACRLDRLAIGYFAQFATVDELPRLWEVIGNGEPTVAKRIMELGGAEEKVKLVDWITQKKEEANESNLPQGKLANALRYLADIEDLIRRPDATKNQAQSATTVSTKNSEWFWAVIVVGACLIVGCLLLNYRRKGRAQT